MSIKANLKTCLVISMFLLVMVSTAAGQIIYVDADATGSNDGSSWADACKYLQDALAAASSGDEIWVAKGIYKPDQGKGIQPGDRRATFRLKSGVAIYGGFPSGGGKWEDGNPNIYETILSGDLTGNDIEVSTPADLQGEPSRAENSYHVVTGSGTDETAVLDGFTITSGTSEGGGMFNDSGSPTVVNCTFSGHCSNVGSAISNRKGSNATLTNCTFTGNWGRWGGAMNNSDSNPTLTNCTFTRNWGSIGAAVDNSWSNPTFINCTFSRNLAVDFGGGGGMRNYYSSPILNNCTFSGNSSTGGAGGMSNFNSSPVLANCLFSGNSARKFGGGVSNSESNPKLINCTFSGNSATLAGGLHNTNRSNPTLTNCILWGNIDRNGMDESAQIVYGVRSVVNYCCIQGWSGKLGGTGIMNADPLFVRNPDDGGDGWGDDPQTRDIGEGTNDDFGDLHLLFDSPCIDAGDNLAVPSSVAVDLDGKARFIDGNGDGTAIVDMGAYEHGR